MAAHRGSRTERTDTTLAARIDAALRRRGGRTALVAGGTVLSGNELCRRSLDLLATIRARGARPGDTVGVVVDRSADSVVAMLAILRLGCAYLPLDLTAPEPWLRHLLALGRTRLLTYSGGGKAAAVRLADVPPCGIVPAGPGREPPPDAPATDPTGDGGSREDHLAYVMGTSGTTGRPKAVPVSEASLLHYCEAFAAHVGGPGTLAGLRMASVTTLAADLGNTMVFPALLFGGELHLVAEQVSRDPWRFAEYLRDHQIDAVKVVPTHLRALLEAGPAVLPGRLLVVGGEPFDLGLLERLEECAPRCQVFNHYGPTETTVGVAMRRVETSRGSASRLRTDGHRSVPIGAALGATELRIVDGRLAPCPDGRIGELVIGGPAVARGYLGDPDRTRQRFVTPRWSGGERVFRSGDRARRSPQGEVELLGRTDRQLKVRGHRVEAAGVEEELRACPGVRDAYVAAREVGDLGWALVAWVHADEGVYEPALREFLLARLPGPMVPSRIAVLRGLPRGANGKVDPRALPDPLGVRLPLRNPLAGEDAVSRIFAEVLELPRDAAHDNFFRLGGHSLAALRVIRRLRDECGIELTVEEFFANAHPAEIARAAGPPRPVGPAAPPGRPTSSVSPQAYALWTHLQLNPHDTAYEIPLRLTIVGPVDAGRIRRALTEFAARHEALRTRLRVGGGEPVAVVDTTPELTLRFDEGGVPNGLDLRSPCGLDVEAGPLMRAAVIEVGRTEDGRAEHLLDIAVHHIAFDGVSTSVLVRELAAMLSDEPLPSAPAPRPGTDAAHRRARSPLGGGARARLGLSAARPSGDPPARCHERRLPADLWPRIEARAAETNTTSFALVAAAWALVLSRQDDEPAVTIGTPADLRPSAGSAEEPAVGYHVNVVVLEVAVQPEDTAADLVARTHHTVGHALADRDWPYAARVADQRAATGTPPARTLLTVERLERATATTVEIRQRTVPRPRPMLGVDICLVVADEGASVQVHHREDVCPEGRARCLGDQLGHVLAQFVADPDTPASRIDVLPDGWAERVLAWSCGPSAPRLRRWGVHGFLDRAAEDPDATALTWLGGEWTRQRLRTAVECTARTLLDLGLGPGHAVAVAVPPSPAAVVAWYAAQSVGAAVLALDPAWPERRRDAAVERARATVEISSPDGLRVVVRGRAAASPPHAWDLTYLVLTSGSTGDPKTVAVPRAALANEQSWFAAEFPLGAGDRVLAYTSPGFDVAVWELVGPLAWGASLVFPDGNRRNDVPHLAAVVREYAVTVIQTVPSLLEALLGETELGRPRLRLILCGGEELPPSLPALVAARAPDAELVNVYGPSETTIDATFHRVDCQAGADRRVPLGRPVAGVCAYVLDDRLRLLPPGAFGQLAIGGDAVGSGYLDDPAETARRFVPDPFSGEPGARLYLTGDRARWSDEGWLEFGGRQDNQVQVRGNRVELEGVEAALRTLPLVEDAVVHLLAAGTPQSRLVALVVPAKGVALTIRELHEGATRLMPSYMVPSGFGLVESIPRLPNGKTARDALPLDALETPARDDGWQTAMEEQVARVWAELLDQGGLERDLPFFASGGTSLLIPKLRLRVAQKTGVALSVPELFEHTTISAQATVLERRLADTDVRPVAVSGRGALRRKAYAARRKRDS